jgi:hypothetical protein
MSTVTTEMMNEDWSEKPIMFVLNSDGKVAWAGQPRKLTAAECREWLQPGYHMEVVPFKTFKAAGFEWVYGKENIEDED